MKRLPPFAIHRPQSLGEASAMLLALEGAAVYAGGTELLLAMKELVIRYDHLVDIKVIPGLRGIEDRAGSVTIGATTTHREVERAPEISAQAPSLAAAARNVANPRVRAAGTLGGNLCFAEPHSDLATLLLCLDATCLVAAPSGERQLTSRELIVGAYETSLEPGEILVSVTIPAAPAKRIGGYPKFQVHERPMLGIAVILDLDAGGRDVVRARVAIGAASPQPLRSAAAEETLLGPLDGVEAAVPFAAERLASDAALIDDDEGSADYKRHLVGVLTRRVIRTAQAQASANGG